MSQKLETPDNLEAVQIAIWNINRNGHAGKIIGDFSLKNVVNLKGRTILHFCEQNFGNINTTKTYLLGKKKHRKSGNHYGVSVAAEWSVDAVTGVRGGEIYLEECSGRFIGAPLSHKRPPQPTAQPKAAFWVED